MWDTTVFNPGEDWSLWDCTISLTFVPWTSDDSYGSSTGSIPALVREVDEAEIDVGNGQTAIVNTVIHVPSGSLPRSPHRRDMLVIGSDTFTVQSAKTQTAGTRYRMQCSKV